MGIYRTLDSPRPFSLSSQCFTGSPISSTTKTEPKMATFIVRNLGSPFEIISRWTGHDNGGRYEGTGDDICERGSGDEDDEENEDKGDGDDRGRVDNGQANQMRELEEKISRLTQELGELGNTVTQLSSKITELETDSTAKDVLKSVTAIESSFQGLQGVDINKLLADLQRFLKIQLQGEKRLLMHLQGKDLGPGLGVIRSIKAWLGSWRSSQICFAPILFPKPSPRLLLAF